ncbi:MAG: GldG family protein [Anaerolineae bacterium]|nr:GldG family protein [Anaerolineae bacterium]
MAQQTPNPQVHDEEPFIPPYYMLILALAGLLVAFFVLFTQPTFNVVGWGGLGIMLLSLVAWVLMAPQQARAAFTGRTMRFGGTSLLVTVIVIVALIAIYTLVRSLDARVDLTERDTYSLTDESRQAIAGIGADPNFAPVKMIAFYGASQAGSRDRDNLLFEDYQQTSAGKITYEYIDPDRNPTMAAQYGISNPGQIAVTTLDAEDNPDVENAEIVNFFSQDQLTNAILRVSASGDFRAYFLDVQDGLQISNADVSGMSQLSQFLTDRLDWTSQMVNLVDLMSLDSDINLNDDQADGIVLNIPGGSQPLTDDQIAFLTDYVNNGGNLVIYADLNFDGGPSLATAENMSNFLYDHFGMRFNESVVLDPVQAIQSAQNIVADDFDSQHYITTGFSGNASMVFTAPHPIELAPTAPENVTVTTLVSSSETSYTKSDVSALMNGDASQTEADPTGPFILAAAAENNQTGGKVVLFGSISIPRNDTAALSSANIVDQAAALNSMIWMTNFEDFFFQVTVQSAQSPQDTLIVVEQQTGSYINLISIFVIPFGILAIGLLVWWNNRESAR